MQKYVRFWSALFWLNKYDLTYLEKQEACLIKDWNLIFYFIRSEKKILLPRLKYSKFEMKNRVSHEMYGPKLT